MRANKNVHAVDLKQAKPADRLSQLCRADDAATDAGVEALRRQGDATGLGSGEFRPQDRSPDIGAMKIIRSTGIRSG
ncbi:hypothetical protein [Methylobacterium sp. ID0610]|uniref:hypothetical protein n=1 Tax=Methylobacterium carpenticola TaxID=3344827 RepID=UPI00367FD58C